MSIFKERIIEVLKEREITIKDFCIQTNLGKNALFDLDLYSPSLNTALKIADSLKLSLDFLVGKSENDSVYVVSNYKIDFYQNLIKELERQTIKKNKFCNDLNFSTDAFTRWKKGAIPYFSNIVLIADYLKIGIDELIGRE